MINIYYQNIFIKKDDFFYGHQKSPDFSRLSAKPITLLSPREVTNLQRKFRTIDTFAGNIFTIL